MAAINEYVSSIATELAAGNATEHTHRPALKRLVEAIGQGITATNEPKRVECGAPDYAVARAADRLTIGYIEAKDVGVSLDEAARSEQLKRYLRSLPNLILTDYLEFRWYVDGEHRRTERLGHIAADGKLVADAAGQQCVVKLLGDFLSHQPQAVATPRDLAERMARLTHIIRDTIVTAFAQGKASELLADLRKAFATALIPDLDQPARAADFADMYAQTLAYGLFAARCNHSGPPGSFRRIGAASEIPKTNPFLRKLFETITGTALDEEPYAGFVDDLVQVLAHADIAAILHEFGTRTRREDPVVHFYETFLATYDPAVREMRGVYYTPEPVVSYIVRSVDHILRTRFGLPGGLADTATVEFERNGNSGRVKQTAPRVLILDPACGTGTFLYAVVDHIREQFMHRGNAGMWSGYVKTQLLPRLFGFELLMAPYAVAHLKLGMQLAGLDLEPAQRARWAYDFASDERLNIYLTNTLEAADSRVQKELRFIERIIADEVRGASRVKRDLPIMVILGNPPYSGVSANMGKWIVGLLKGRLPSGEPVASYYEADGKPLGEKKLWLQDDYVKFIRWAQWRIESTGAGVVGLVTNNGYLDNPTFRGMRQQLMRAFTEIYILDLHGSSRKREKSPDGSKDENLFDITQGVGICLLVKTPGKAGGASVYHAEIWGSRSHKNAWLGAHDLACTKWACVRDSMPLHLFVPRREAKRVEYQRLWSLRRVAPSNVTGIVTARDRFAMGFEAEEVLRRIRTFLDRKVSEDVLRSTLGLTENYAWRMPQAREDLRKELARTRQSTADMLKSVLYRPFDRRLLFYHPAVVWRTRKRLMAHMLAGTNLGLIATRQTRDAWDVLATRHIIGHKSCAAYDINSLFPLYLYPDGDRLGLAEHYPPGPGGRVPNLNPDFVADVAGRLKLTFVSDGTGDLKKTFGPEDIFHYIYALFHSPTYRKRYAEFLKIDFPRVPLTSDRKLFRKLCALGSELVGLHLLESVTIPQFITRYPITGENRVEKGNPKYLAAGGVDPATGAKLVAGRVYINKTQYFDGVPQDVWDFHVGGYQVCEKWLKDRRGRALSYDDLTHYQKIVVALHETIRLMAEIDAAIPAWPIR